MGSRDRAKPSRTNRRQVLGRSQRPLDEIPAAHTIVKALEECDYDIPSPDAFVRRVQHVDYGLSAEIEFAAILRWLGVCSLVHRLNEDAFNEPPSTSWEVPDLLAVFKSGDASCSAVIEVKTTSKNRLRFRTDYLARLQAYADLVSQPLLLAWKPRKLGFWILVDPSHARPLNSERVELDLESALRDDLMCTVAGDFFIVPQEGAGLIFEASLVGEKQPTSEGYQAVFRIDNAYAQDGKGDRFDSVPSAIVWTLLSATDERQSLGEDNLVQAFIAPGKLTRAQLVLRTAASVLIGNQQRIHWKRIGENLDSVVSSREVRAQAFASLGTFIQFVLYQAPHTAPHFLPDGWLVHREEY